VEATDVVAGLLPGATPGLTCEVNGDDPPHVSSWAPGVQFICVDVNGPE
jgi:hypothetical protein